MNLEKKQNIDDTLTKQFSKNDGFFKRNQTQITIIFIGLLPSLILITSTFISLYFMQISSVQVIQQFADQMYQDQIKNSKQQNYAVVFQINQQVQKIAWQMNLLNEFLGRQLLGQVINNKNFIPALHNVDRTYLNLENPIILNMFRQNPLLTSVWHQVERAYLEQLDERELFELKQTTTLDVIIKSIKFDNQNQVARWMQIQTIYSGLTNDGLIFMTSNNTTYAEYEPPNDCPYQGPYKLDLRCRYYYQPTIDDISTLIFAPSLNFGKNGPYYSSNFCQRRINLSSQKQNDIFSIMCITLDLSTIPIFFQNFGQNSKFQMLIDPQSLSIVYNSQANDQQQQTTIKQVETDYLEDKSQAQIFLGNLTQNSNVVLLNTSKYSLDYQLKISQKMFEYSRNGTDCFVHLNIISMIDKVPKIEILRNDKLDKFQLKNAYLFLDVLTKENLQIYAKNLENTIQFYNYIFTYSSWGVIFLILGIQIYHSFLMSRDILNPVIHLTEILKCIKIQNSKDKKIEKENQLNRFEINNSFHISQSIFNQNSSVQDQQILIDEQIDADFEGVCHSRDTQDLLNSFQDLFKMLRFTTQNFYREDSGLQLLNLINQIEHFKQFGNNRALGVCYNNLGVIHFNCGRYQEACENFQKSIIYANYELNIYSHQGEGTQFTDQIKRFTVHLRSSLQNKTSYEHFPDSKNHQKFSNHQEKSHQNYNNYYQMELQWSLYNRKMNHLKSMLNYIQENKNNLSEILEDLALETLSISQIYLPPCYKREINDYYALSKGLINQESCSLESPVLNILSQIYIKIYEKKYGKLFQDSPNYFKKNEQLKESDPFQDYLINSKKILKQQNRDAKNPSSIILLSPIKGIQKSKQNMNIKSIIKNKVNYLIKNEFNQEIKNQQYCPKSFNQTLNIKLNKKFDKKDKQCHNQKKINSITEQKIEQEKDNKLNDQIIYEISKKHTKEQNQSSPNLSDNRMSLNPLLLLQEKEKLNSKLTQSELEIQKIQKYNLNSNKKVVKRKEKINELQKSQKIIFYQVRKHKNNKQVLNYQFSSDIYFQYCTLEQARYQIKKQNYYNAALVLTNSLEQCQQYLPHLKKQLMNLLQEVFKLNKLNSLELEVENQKYNEMTNYNFNIFVVSACQKNTNKLKLFSLCCDIINEILFKQNDNFGIIQFNFEEQLFTQLIATTSIKLIQSNPYNFELILLSLIVDIKNNKIFDFKTKPKEKNELFDKFFSQSYEKSQINLEPVTNANNNMKINNSFKQGNSQFKDSKSKQRDSINSNQIIQKLNNIENQNEIQKLINFDQNKSSSNIFLFSSSKQCLKIKNNQTIQDIPISEYFKQDQKTNQNTFSIFKRNSFNLDFQKNQFLIQDNKSLDKSYLDQMIHNKQYKIQKNIENEEEVSAKFMENVKTNQTTIFDQPLKNSSNQQYQLNDQIFEENLNNSNSNLNKNSKTLQNIDTNLNDQIDSSDQKMNNNNYKKNQSQKYSSEYIFHLGVHASLKQFILNSDQKLNIHLAQNKYKNFKLKNYQFQKTQHIYLIYFTDQYFQISNKNLLQRLTDLLCNLEIELLVLLKNDIQQLDEFNNLENIIIGGISVISFFNSEEKLLQYIYNYREHLKNYQLPMIIEHF